MTKTENGFKIIGYNRSKLYIEKQMKQKQKTSIDQYN